MEIKISQVVAKMPEKSEGICMCDCIPCKTDSCDNCELGKYQGYKNGDMCHEEFCCQQSCNKLIDQISSLPISKDKVIGMVIFDLEKLARTIADNRGGHRGFAPSSWDYQEADAIIQSKSDILTIKGDV